MADQNPNVDLLKDLQTEFSTLDRVSHRLAMTDAGAPLEKVLSLLLPRLLSRIGKNDDAKRENKRGVNKRKLAGCITDTEGGQEKLDEMYEKIHKKMTEMLMHTMKRVRDDRECKLPCGAILELLAGNDSNAFTVNLSLAFLTVGVNRCTPVECSDLLPGLLEFLESLLLGSNEQEGQDATTSSIGVGVGVGVGHLIDPSRKMRYNQTYHLILRCLEKVSHNPLESAAVRRALKSESSVSSDGTPISVSSLAKTKDILISRPVLAAAVFDLFLDIFVYAPVATTSSLIPNGMSTFGYQCLSVGAASEKSGCKSWKEEFATRTMLKELKLRFLDLIAPCRRFAIFLQDDTFGVTTADASSISQQMAGLGISRTVALMVILCGDADLDVKSKAESYLKAHLDTYRGKDNKDSASNDDDFISKNDPLLGNQVALANSLLVYVIGGVSSASVLKDVFAGYTSQVALSAAGTRLGLVHDTNYENDVQQKAALSSYRMKLSDTNITPVVKFVAKMLEDSPNLFNVMDMANAEADVAAFCVGSLSLRVFQDLWKPGSSGSSSVEAAASLLNALCLRLSLFYESRNPECSSRLKSLLVQSMSLACSVITPISSGESTSSSNGTRVATVQIEIRDKVYGVICTLARSNRFSLDETYALFNSGSETSAEMFASFSTAKLLFGCAKHETDALITRATSALDALLASYVRVVNVQLEKLKSSGPVVVQDVSSNPWAGSTPTNGQSTSTGQEKRKGFSSECLSQALLPLLWSAARRGQTKSSRLSAARWSEELLLLLDCISAYHLLCFLSGDDDSSVSMVSRKALGIDSTLGQDISLTSLVTNANADRSVDFSQIAAVILGKQMISGMPTYAGFHIRAQSASLRFLIQLLLGESNFYGDEQLTEYVVMILKTLSTYTNRPLTRDETDLIDECSICLAGCTSSSNEARRVVLDHGFEDIADQAVMSKSSKARRNFSDVMRALYEDQSLWSDGNNSDFTISAWLDKSGLFERAKLCRDKLEAITTQSSFVLGEVHGSAFLSASCVRAFRLAATSLANLHDPKIDECWKMCSSIISLLGKGLAHSEIVIGNACSKSLIIAFGYASQDAPVLDSHLYESMSVALWGMNESLRHFSSIDHADSTRASSLIQAAGILLAASTSGAGAVNIGHSRLQCVESLFSIVGSVVSRKDDELCLAVGEALVKYADAVGVGKWKTSSSNTELETPRDGQYDEALAQSLPPHKHVMYTILKREIVASNPMKKTGCAPILLALVGHASRLALLDPLFASRAMIREVSDQLQVIQHSFIQLLRDPKSKQLARESCCRGLAACRGLSLASHTNSSSNNLNDLLLKSFGQTSNFGQSAMIESNEQARERRNQERTSDEDIQQTEVGGAAGMGEAALGAYKEMASAAMAVERPDILYTLMILSTNHPIWLVSDVRDRYSASALLGHDQGLNDADIRSALKPHLGKLLPSLLRACNDPSKQTREQMNGLWIGLTGGGSEARDIITQNLIPTLDSLIKDASSKLWRTRAGACGALSDIIVGRSWDDLGGGDVEEDEGDAIASGAAVRLLRLWISTVRALDDVRNPVRERGDSLGRSLRALTTRLCDPSSTNMTADEEAYMSNDQKWKYKSKCESNAEKAATVSLGWLVTYGLNQPCAEATGICVSSLLGVIDIAKPATLQPVLDSLIGSLLMALSGLEPAALNYLQVRAAGNDQGTESYDRLESARVRISQSGPIFEALQKCLDMVKFIDLNSQKKIVPELDSALRRGAGFATRAAVADAVTSLCATCPNAFVFPGQSTTNPSVRLFRALYFANERERGASSKDRMTHALGSLAELVPGKAVRQLAAKACERYRGASGGNNDPSVRKAAASTVRAIVVRATSQIQEGGASDIWAKIVMPTAYIGRHDKDAKVASLWNEVWDEGGAAIGSRDDAFGVLLQEKLLPNLVTNIIVNLRSTSWSNRLSACAVIMELTTANILAPTPCSTNDVPDQTQQRSKIRAAATCLIIFECVDMISRTSRIWTGKGEVMKALSSIAGKWASIAPMDSSNCDRTPLVLSSQSQDDLFVNDSWFKSTDTDNIGHGINGDVDDVQEKASEDENNLSENDMASNQSEKDTALDLTDEANFDDEGEPSSDNDDNMPKCNPLTYVGLCRLLCDEGLRVSKNEFTEGALPYTTAALGSLSSFLQAFVAKRNTEDYDKVLRQQQCVYDIIAPRLYAFVSQSQNGTAAPLLVAKSLECLASAFYDDFGDNPTPDHSNSLAMLRFMAECSGASQPAWSVRQSGVLAASRLVSKMTSKSLSKNGAIVTILGCATHALNDRKFWKVRQAGLELLLSLVNRVGKQRVNDELLLEAVLPYKEKIIGIARQSLSDNESQVTATASQITLAMSCWP